MSQFKSIIEQLFKKAHLHKRYIDPHRTPEQIFQKWTNTPYSTLLLSDQGDSYVTYDPILSIQIKNHLICIRLENKRYVVLYPILQFLNICLLALHNFVKKQFPTLDYPFMGYLAYEAGKYFNNFSFSTEDLFDLPEIDLNLPAHFYKFSNKNEHFQIILKKNSIDKTHAMLQQLEMTALQEHKDLRKNSCLFEEFYPKEAPLPLEIHRGRYFRDLQKLQKKIIKGELYQGNYTYCLSEKTQRTSWDLFIESYRTNPSPYCAYLKTDHTEIVSSSPELFLLFKNSQLKANPIKGTMKRSSHLKKDRQLQNQLLQSHKDRAELSMIVDLFRNDFHQICYPGSVLVSKEFQCKSIYHIHHLYSQIMGDVLPSKNSIDILMACFPSGSITGCPKIKSIEILSKLEKRTRSIYSGSIGMISYNYLNISVAIRTMIRLGDHLYFQTGGGITIDSQPQREYRETLLKADAFLDILQRNDR